MSRGGFAPGTPVLVYLHTPRERIFGVLEALLPAGVAVRGIELTGFEDYLRQEVRRETGLGLVSLFYPMSRVERVERDETVGGLEGVADRFRRQTGRSIQAAAGRGRRSAPARSVSTRRKPR